MKKDKEITLSTPPIAQKADAPLITLEALKKVYLTEEVETHALTGVDLTIRRGEYVSIVGPSGCGKSTLLSILGLLDAPSSGNYILNGQRVSELDARSRARIRNREIGFIFQACASRRARCAFGPRAGS